MQFFWKLPWEKSVGRIFRIFALATGLIGAVIGAQAPEFAQQYRQRLGGRIDELDRSIKLFEKDAKRHKKTPEQAVELLLSSKEPVIQLRGKAHKEAVSRFHHYTQQRDNIKNSKPVFRIIYMLGGIDPDTASKTLNDYEMAIPVTFEGVVSSGVGFIVFYGILWFLHRILIKFFRIVTGKNTSKTKKIVEERKVTQENNALLSSDNFGKTKNSFRFRSTK